MKVSIVPATKLDIEDIIRRSPVQAHPNAKRDLKRFLVISIMSWTGLVENKVACVWGIISPTILSDSAYLWLLTTDLVDEHPFLFVRHSQMVVEKLLEDFPCIKGHVVAGETRSIRWLKWLGFKLGHQEGGLIDFERRRA